VLFRSGDGELKTLSPICLGSLDLDATIAFDHSGDGGDVRIWSDGRKTIEISGIPLLVRDAENHGPYYIEGVRSSNRVGDVTLTLDWKDVSQSGQVVKQMTVTPLITGFTVSAPPNGQGNTIKWIDAANPRYGVETVDVTFNARLITEFLQGQPVFIQNVIGVTNSDGARCGLLYRAGTGYENADYWLTTGPPTVDTANEDDVPEYTYKLASTYNPNPPPSVWTIAATDAPAIDFQPGGEEQMGAIQSLNSRAYLRTHLVWKYPSGIYYVLAQHDWQVDLSADHVDPGPAGLNTLRATGGVLPDPSYEIAHPNPPLIRVTGPVANEAITLIPCR